MSLSTLQLAGTSAFALLAGWAPWKCAIGAGDDLGSNRLALDLDWKTKRTAADVLTELLDVDGIRVVANRHLWVRPDTVALRHDFAPDTRFPLFCEAGIDRVVYLESRALSSFSALSTHGQRSVGMMAEVGASWRLTGQLKVETGLHWMGLTPDARLMRTDAGWVSGDPVTLTLSLAWRGE